MTFRNRGGGGEGCWREAGGERHLEIEPVGTCQKQKQKTKKQRGWGGERRGERLRDRTCRDLKIKRREGVDRREARR